MQNDLSEVILKINTDTEFRNLLLENVSTSSDVRKAAFLRIIQSFILETTIETQQLSNTNKVQKFLLKSGRLPILENVTSRPPRISSNITQDNMFELFEMKCEAIVSNINTNCFLANKYVVVVRTDLIEF